MTRLKTPTASEPILFDTYKLNNMPMLLMMNAVRVKTKPLIRKIFVFLKLSPF